MNKPRFALYNDGMVSIYREKEKRSSFSAKINAVSLDDLEFIAKLAYAETSKREQDLEFAEQHSFSLELKVKTRFIKGVDSKCKAVINGKLYDIAYVDTTRTELYLYMQEVGDIA